MYMRFGLFFIPQGGDDDTDLVDFPGHTLSSLRHSGGWGGGNVAGVGGEEGRGSGIGM